MILLLNTDLIDDQIGQAGVARAVRARAFDLVGLLLVRAGERFGFFLFDLFFEVLFLEFSYFLGGLLLCFLLFLNRFAAKGSKPPS